MNVAKLLLSPVKIGGLEIKNRIVMPPMVTCNGSDDHFVTDNIINWYATRAKGGVGLIIVEFTGILKQGEVGFNMLGIWDDAFIPGFKNLVKAVHAYDTKIFIQLAHGGRQTRRELIGGISPVAPSALPCPLNEPLYHEIPHELTVPEIDNLVKQFAQAARRVRESGFDGLEIHGAHGYLISEFMSPYSNKRHDDYGGNLTARMKFPLEIIKAIRQQVGPSFPVSFRLSGNEHVPDGHTIEDSKRVARILESAGVNCLHVSGGVYESFWSQIPPFGVPEGWHANDAAAIKSVVKIPVITVGRIKSPDIAEDILAQGKADLVAIGRQLIADPDWPTKVSIGDYDSIRPCIGCTQNCINREIVNRRECACIYNTAAGMEKEAEIIPTKKPKKVVIVGGGPGGLEAARVAALRGHQVTLYEKSDRLGGRFNLACIPPYKQEFALAIKWLENQVIKLGVKVELNKEVTPQLISQMIPDVVIVATGAVTKIPKIPGMDKDSVVIAEDVLAGRVKLGTKVLILGAGGVGCELADFMGGRGKQVTLVDMLPEIGVASGIPILVAQLLMPRLAQHGVKIMTSAKVKNISGNCTVCDVCGVDQTITDVDQIIVALGAESVNSLVDKVKGTVKEYYVIGDAKEPRTAFEATREGAEVARKI